MAIRTHIPNILTALRIALLAPVFVLIVLSDEIGLPQASARWFALACYLAAGLTDLADGYLARRLKVATVFGAMFDKLADRLMTLVTAIALVAAGDLAGPLAVLAVILVARDFAFVALEDWRPERISRPKALENLKIALCWGGLAVLIIPTGIAHRVGVIAVSLGAALAAYTVARYAAQARGR